MRGARGSGLAGALQGIATPPSVTTNATTLYLFTIGLIVETFHITEHTAQVYQHAWLGWPISDAHGIIFFLDLEWNHFIFNSLYWIFLLVVFRRCTFQPRTFATTAFLRPSRFRRTMSANTFSACNSTSRPRANLASAS